MAILISNGILILPPHLSYRVNALKHAHLDLFKLRQLVRENIEGVLRAVAHLLILLPEELRIKRRQPRRGAVRAGSVGELAGGVSRVLSAWRLLSHGGSLIWIAKLAVGLAHHGHEAVHVSLSVVVPKCYRLLHILGHYGPVRLARLPCAELSRKPILVLHMLLVMAVRAASVRVVVLRRRHRVTREYVLDLVAKEAHEALLSLRVFTLPFVNTMRLLSIYILGVPAIKLSLVIVEMPARRIIQMAQLLVVEVDAAMVALRLLPSHVAFREHGAPATTASANGVKQLFLFVNIVRSRLLVLRLVARRPVVLLLSFSDAGSVLIIRRLGVSKLRRKHVGANRELAQLWLGLINRHEAVHVVRVIASALRLILWLCLMRRVLTH